MTRNPFVVPLIGDVMGGIMARGNRAAEAEAIAALDPGPRDAVLALGFGPGVGIQLLADRVPAGWIAGVDPSAPMCRAAARRNRAGIERGQIQLERTTAEALPWAGRTFDGAITVNTIQMWDPLDRSIAEVARVLRPGARLVAITHDWALRFGHPSVDAWWETIAPLLSAHGFADAYRWQARADRGSAIGMTATRQDT